MSYYAAFLNLTGKKCLVIGRGPLAEEKATTLRRSGAIVHFAQEFDEGDLEECWLVCADVEKEEALRISRAAEVRRIFVNIVDKPEFCTFILPSVLQRGDLHLAISTSGKSPSLAAKIRRNLETQYGSEYGDILEVLGDTREWVKQQIPQYKDRQCFYWGLLDLPLEEIVRHSQKDGIRRLLEEKVEEYLHEGGS